MHGGSLMYSQDLPLAAACTLGMCTCIIRQSTLAHVVTTNYVTRNKQSGHTRVYGHMYKDGKIYNLYTSSYVYTWHHRSYSYASAGCETTVHANNNTFVMVQLYTQLLVSLAFRLILCFKVFIHGSQQHLLVSFHKFQNVYNSGFRNRGKLYSSVMYVFTNVRKLH